MASARSGGGRRRWRIPLLAVFFFLLLPIAISTLDRFVTRAYAVSWWQARSDSSGQAPDPATTQEAVVQVYAARTWGWRGAFGVHTWIAVKPAGADSYERLEVIGWGVRRGRPAVQISRYRDPDGYWFGSKPDLLVDLRGDGVDAVIREIYDAAGRYPYPDSYRVWPGPNSNTFTAFVGREVPALKLDLPPHAVGKDFLPHGAVIAGTPSGTGVQVSLYGLLGLMVALEEGIEINLLGLTVGVDVLAPALKLPGVGRVGWSDTTTG